MDFPSTFSVGYLTFLEKDFLELIHLVLSVDEEQSFQKFERSKCQTLFVELLTLYNVCGLSL